jgi:hypothetical protein
MRKPRDEKPLTRKIRTFLLTHPLLPYRTLSGHFLTKDAMRVLICCIYDLDDSFYFDWISVVSHLDSYLGPGKCPRPLDHIELYHAVKYLENTGLIKNVSGDCDNFTFRITYEAISYFQLKRRAAFYRFLNSIALPVIVSTITAIIVYLLNM